MRLGDHVAAQVARSFGGITVSELIGSFLTGAAGGASVMLFGGPPWAAFAVTFTVTLGETNFWSLRRGQP